MVGINLKSTSEVSGKPEPSLSTLEEKVDKILKYHKTMRNLAIFRAFISFMIFLVFIVLPIAGSVYLFQKFKDKVDFDKVYNQYTELSNTLGDLKSKTDSLGDLKKAVSPEALGAELKKFMKDEDTESPKPPKTPQE